MKTIAAFFLLIFTIFLTIHSVPIFFSKPTSDHRTLCLASVPFSTLPAWSTLDLKSSFNVLLNSCAVFLKQSPDESIGNAYIPLYVKDMMPACRAAQHVNRHSNPSLRLFFEKHFNIVRYMEGEPLQGLFTGYYFPSVEGHRVKTKQYTVPIYGLPSDRVIMRLKRFDAQYPDRTFVGRLSHGELIPYYDRKAIDQGVLEKTVKVLVWVKSPIDRLFIEIQGSGTILLPHGKQMVLGYAGGNGAPYTAVGKVLLDKGVLPREQISMQTIRAYLEAHPEEMDEVIHKNQSFVFFKPLNQAGALGAQGVLLTPGYSLAVDKHYVPLGLPILLETTRPDSVRENKTHRLLRLMISQDTGGAIRGPVRGDVYWGAGQKATEIAGKMKNRGTYWIFIPKTLQNQSLILRKRQ